MNYLDMLINEFHSTTVATIGDDGYPQTRVIDMMLYDENGIYFLTARGKAFYSQLMKQLFIAVSATKDKRAISLRGKIKNVGHEKLNEIFEKNSYMKEIYPDDTKTALDVFCIYDAQGEFFDISEPSKIKRESFIVGKNKKDKYISGYFVGDECIGCKLCYSVCPQKCIDIFQKPVCIIQNNCLHCGRCSEICPKQIIYKK